MMFKEIFHSLCCEMEELDEKLIIGFIKSNNYAAVYTPFSSSGGLPKIQVSRRDIATPNVSYKRDVCNLLHEYGHHSLAIRPSDKILLEQYNENRVLIYSRTGFIYRYGENTISAVLFEEFFAWVFAFLFLIKCSYIKWYEKICVLPFLLFNTFDHLIYLTILLYSYGIENYEDRTKEDPELLRQANDDTMEI